MKKTKHPKDSKKTVKNGTTTIIHRGQQISNLIPKKTKKKQEMCHLSALLNKNLNGNAGLHPCQIY